MENSAKKIPEISVVVLAYREGPAVQTFAQKVEDVLGGAQLDYEIVLVSNYLSGSTDNTPQLARDWASQHSRTIAITKEKIAGQGMGWDARSGMEVASGATIAVIDGDGQMPAEDIVAVYNKLKKDNLDLCKTIRVERQDGFQRKFITKVYNAFVSLLFPRLSVRDINGKPKIFTREAYEQFDLKEDGWFLDGEIMIRIAQLGLRHDAVPTTFKTNEHRSSYVKPRMIVGFIKSIIAYRIRTLL